MSFLQGLTSGQQVAQGWLDTYEKSRLRKESADLKTQREGILTAQPEYSQGYTAEQGQQLEAMASAVNPETGRPYYNVQAGQGGNYTVTPDFTEAQTPRTGMDTGLQYGVANVELQPTGLGRAGVVAQPIPFNQQRVANFLGSRVEGDLTPERMETMRSRALANTLVDPMERQRALIQMDENERAARRAAQVEELTGLQISGAKTTAQRESEAAAREAANRAAILKVGDRLQAGGNIDIPSLYKVAGEAGADPEVLVKTAADFLNITEKSAKATTEKLLRDIDAASVSPTKFNTLLKNSFDPDPNDNLSPELRPAAGGGFQVFYGDKPMTQVFKDTKDMPALSQLASFYRDRLSGNPLATAVQIEALNAKRASAAKDYAMGGYYAAGGRAMGGAGKGGLKQKVADFKEVYGRDPTESEKGILAGLVSKESNKPEFTPKEYAATIKSLTDAGFSQTDALIRADQLYGRGPADASVDVGLQKMNKTKATGTAAAPIEVQPGESRMTAPGTSVRGPLNQFLRESRRGILGGVEYFYTDPVTGRRYTTEQYNQLQTK